MGDAGADAFTLAAIFGWSDIRMAMRYTHAMEDAKRRAVEAIAQRQRNSSDPTSDDGGRDARGPSKNVRDQMSCDTAVTNEKRKPSARRSSWT